MTNETTPYFPDQAIDHLRRSKFDPAAKPSLELLSGSFLWDDEFEGYLRFVAYCRTQGCMKYWEPVAFRSSVIRGQPDESCRLGWEELRRACPTWPGFREERYSHSLRADLERQLSEEL